MPSVTSTPTSWVRGDQGLRVAVLSETPETIERELTMLAALDAQNARQQNRAIAGGHVARAAARGPGSGGLEALDIVAEGRIAQRAVRRPVSPVDPGRRLVETHALTVITSMYAAGNPQESAQARPFRLVALASGSGTLRSARTSDPAPRLQAATTEIQAIADLFESRDRTQGQTIRRRAR